MADAIGAFFTFFFGISGRHVRHNCRWHLHGPLNDALRRGEPLILAAWHQDVLPLFHYLANYTALGPRRRMVMMSSRSFDGELTNRIMRPFNYHLLRGSAGKAGSRAALKGLARELRAGRSVTIIADGPRPPAYLMKPGALFLARETGVPLYLVRIWARPQMIIPKTWFRMVVPAPRAHYALFSEGPMDVSGDLEEARLRSEQTLHRLGEELDAFLYLRPTVSGGKSLADWTV